MRFLHWSKLFTHGFTALFLCHFIYFKFNHLTSLHYGPLSAEKITLSAAHPTDLRPRGAFAFKGKNFSHTSYSRSASSIGLRASNRGSPGSLQSGGDQTRRARRSRISETRGVRMLERISRYRPFSSWSSSCSIPCANTVSADDKQGSISVVRIRIWRIPYVFGPPGSGSVSQRYSSRSGSFYHQAKIVRKHWFLQFFDFFMTFIFGKWCKCTNNEQKN